MSFCPAARSVAQPPALMSENSFFRFGTRAPRLTLALVLFLSSGFMVLLSFGAKSATANRVVNSSDVSSAKSQSDSAASPANFRADVNANGDINSSDLGLIKSNSGTSLP